VIIDVQNALNELKNGSMPHFSPSSSLNFSTFAIVMVVKKTRKNGSPVFGIQPITYED
jgi:hypothetical protein